MNSTSAVITINAAIIASQNLGKHTTATTEQIIIALLYSTAIICGILATIIIIEIYNWGNDDLF